MRKIFPILFVILLSATLKAPPISAEGPRVTHQSQINGTSKENVFASADFANRDISKTTTLDEAPTRGGSVYPVPFLEPAQLTTESQGYSLAGIPSLSTKFLGRYAAKSQRGDYVFFTAEPQIQEFAQKLVSTSRDPTVAIVVMNPQNGKILAMAGKSDTIPNALTHAGYPTASLFKLVTTTTALESKKIQPDAMIAFRGGTYELSEWNYQPNPSRDHNIMSLGKALGKSCNPVFGRVALKYLTPAELRKGAERFGFNFKLPFDITVPSSGFNLSDNSDYEFSRTAAGFGDVTTSPFHAALIMSALANHGLMPRPHLIEKIVDASGAEKYRSSPTLLQKVASEHTARQMLDLMTNTTVDGTSKREFFPASGPALPGIQVAAKTGTLKGTSPAGLTNWFVGAAPLDNPTVAISVVVVDPNGISSKASRLGRQILQKVLGREPSDVGTPSVHYARATRSKQFRSNRKGAVLRKGHSAKLMHSKANAHSSKSFTPRKGKAAAIVSKKATKKKHRR